MERFDRPGPGFAPAAGERATVVWQGIAVCWVALVVLSALLTSAALVAIMVLYSGTAAGRDAVAGNADPSGPSPVGTGEGTVLVRAISAEGLRFAGAASTLGGPRRAAGTTPQEHELRVYPDGGSADASAALATPSLGLTDDHRVEALTSPQNEE